MSNNISVIIPFSHNFLPTPTLASDTAAGRTGHISPWHYVGTTTNEWLYGYDAINNSNSWYINLLEGTIENEVGTNNSLKYIKQPSETVNLSSFYCQNIKVTLHEELNKYYSLENIFITTKQSTNTHVKRYIAEDSENNVYYFNIYTNLSIAAGDIEDSFNFTLKYRQNEDALDQKIYIRHDPRSTELIKLTLNGYNLTYNVFNITTTGTVDFREYSKRLYIRDSTEHGYLRYNVIKERYQYNNSSTASTMFEFHIADSALYNVVIQGADTNNSITVPELKIKCGKFVCTIPDAQLTSGNESGLSIDFCELILYDSETSKVPYGSKILRVTKTLPL